MGKSKYLSPGIQEQLPPAHDYTCVFRPLLLLICQPLCPHVYPQTTHPPRPATGLSIHRRQSIRRSVRVTRHLIRLGRQRRRPLGSGSRPGSLRAPSGPSPGSRAPLRRAVMMRCRSPTQTTPPRAPGSGSSQFRGGKRQYSMCISTLKRLGIILWMHEYVMNIESDMS